MKNKNTSLLKGSPLLLLVAGAHVLGYGHLAWLLGSSFWLLTSKYYLIPRKLERFDAPTIPSLIGAVYGRLAQGMIGLLYGSYCLLLLVKVIQQWISFGYIVFTPLIGGVALLICWGLILCCFFINNASFSKTVLGALVIVSLLFIPVIVHKVKPSLNIDALFEGGRFHPLSVYNVYFGKIDLSIFLTGLLVGHPLLSHVLLEKADKRKTMRIFQLAGVTLLCLSIIFRIVQDYTKEINSFSKIFQNIVFVHRLSSYVLVAGFLLYMASLHFSVDYMASLVKGHKHMRWRYIMAMCLSSLALLLAYFVPSELIVQVMRYLLPVLAVSQYTFLTINLSVYPGKKAFFFTLLGAPLLYAFLSMLNEPLIEPYALGIVVLFSCIVLLVAHYVEHNGFYVSKRNFWEKQEFEELAFRGRDLKKALMVVLYFPVRMAAYARKALSLQRTPYRSLSLYFFLISLLGIYLVPLQIASPYIDLAYVLFLINMCLSVITLLHSFWPRILAPYFALYWHAFLMFYLVTLPTMLYFLSLYEVVALVNFILAIVLLARFVNPMSFFCLHIIGLFLSFVMMHYLVPDVLQDFFSKPKEIYTFTYSYVISRLVGAFFIRKNKRTIRETKEKLEALVKRSLGIVSNTLNITQSHASIIDLCIKSMEVTEEVDSIEKEPCLYIRMKQASFDTMKENLEKLFGSTHTSKAQLKRAFLPINARIKKQYFRDYHAASCVQEAIETFVKDYEAQKIPTFLVEEDFTFRGSNQILVAILVQILRNAHESSHTEGDISVHIKDHKIYITNSGSTIDKADLPHVFNQFFTRNPKNLGLGLFFAKEAMQAFGGDIYFSPTSRENTTCIVLAF